MKKPLLCKLGLHKWSKPRFMDYGYSSNVLNWKKICEKEN